MIFSKKYKVNPIEDDVVPEETLLDSASSFASVEVPITKNVFRVFYSIIILLFLFYGIKAFQLQVVQGAHYAFIADHSRLSHYPIPALRGIIYDSEGDALVENVPTFDLIGLTADISKWENPEANYLELSEILDMPPENIIRSVSQSEDIAIFVIKKQLTKDEAIEIRTSLIKGVHVAPYARRYYTGGPYLSHALGYTSNISPKELVESGYYLATDRIGRLGVEGSYEDVLRGDHIFFDFDSQTVVKSDSYKSGNNIQLYINRDVQKHLYDIMGSMFSAQGIRRGSAVFQDVNTGGIIAMVSFPTFNPNAFEQSYDPENSGYVEAILTNRNKPLFNRTISGLYAPGSTIKPLLALAGLKEGVVTPSTIVYAEGSISIQSEIDPDVVYVYNDWKVHGWTDMRKAISDSVDVYFYALGGGYGGIKGLGIDKISQYYREFLVEADLKIDLPATKSGVVPDEEWKIRNRGENWYVGDTYNVSIGQGDLLVTPMWINAYIGAIANGGEVLSPKIVKEIQGPTGNVIQKTERLVLGTVDFTQAQMDVVRAGMRQTVTQGTGRSLNTIPVALAGKTGTTQVSGSELNSLFSVYGPYDNPKVVLTIVAEDITEDQTIAAHVAKEFLSWYFNAQDLNK